MDGNRRWARKRNLPLMTGHTKGYNNIEPIIKHALSKGISYITFWAFSTENWNRDPSEVAYLMNIFRKLFKSSLMKRLKKEGVRIQILGDMSRFPQDIQQGVHEVIADTQMNDRIVVSIALNYGGRDEIIRAVQKIIADQTQQITEDLFAQYLFTKDIPEPDMIIRTGGEQRLSGFLPWQSVYSELYFTEKYWPEFSADDFDAALSEYSSRERRFGK
jgi:undecaprenyl diphosphate synthase